MEWKQSVHLSKFLNLGPLETTLTLQMHQKGIFVYINTINCILIAWRNCTSLQIFLFYPQEIDDRFSGITFNVRWKDLLCAKNWADLQMFENIKASFKSGLVLYLRKSGYRWPDFGVFFEVKVHARWKFVLTSGLRNFYQYKTDSLAALIRRH